MFFMMKDSSIQTIENVIPPSHKNIPTVYIHSNCNNEIIWLVIFYLPSINLKVKGAIARQFSFGVKYRKSFHIGRNVDLNFPKPLKTNRNTAKKSPAVYHLAL